MENKAFAGVIYVVRTVQEIICKLNDDEEKDLKASPFWRKAESLIMQAKVSKTQTS